MRAYNSAELVCGVPTIVGSPTSHYGVCLAQAPVLGEEPACSGDGEELVVLFQPAAYLSHLVPRWYCVNDYRELRHWDGVWWRKARSWLALPLIGGWC